MTWENKCRLIKEDSATVVRYFDNRYLQFFNLVVKSPHACINQVTEYFTRYEFAEQGTIHIHWFAYLENVPEYGETDNDTVARFCDNIISCSSDVPEAHRQYIQYQIHRHSRTCHIGNTQKCRFFSIPPMLNTVILEPIDFESEAEENKFKTKWRKIHKHLNQYGLALEFKITYDKLLVELDMLQKIYKSAVRTSLVRPKLFLKCRPC